MITINNYINLFQHLTGSNANNKIKFDIYKHVNWSNVEKKLGYFLKSEIKRLWHGL